MRHVTKVHDTQCPAETLTHVHSRTDPGTPTAGSPVTTPGFCQFITTVQCATARDGDVSVRVDSVALKEKVRAEMKAPQSRQGPRPLLSPFLLCRGRSRWFPHSASAHG